MALITQPTDVPAEWAELRRESFQYRECRTRQLAQRQPLLKNPVKDVYALRSKIAHNRRDKR